MRKRQALWQYNMSRILVRRHEQDVKYEQEVGARAVQYEQDAA